MSWVELGVYDDAKGRGGRQDKRRGGGQQNILGVLLRLRGRTFTFPGRGLVAAPHDQKERCTWPPPRHVG